MRARLEELQEALADTQTGGNKLDPSIAARHDRIVADLTAERDLVQQRLKDAVAALETIRLNLLKLHAGTGSVKSLTTDLGLAREIAGEIDRHVQALRDVEDALANVERDATDPAVAQRHDRIVADLTAERGAVEQRLADAVAALETIRLNLLRLHAGTGTVHSLTTDLGLARDLTRDISAQVEGYREIEKEL